MPTRRQQLLQLLRRRAFAADDTPLPDIISAAGLRPSASDWHHFADRLLLLLGALSLVFSLLFFIAYNWVELGRMGRFALVELALVGAVALYCWQHRRRWVAALALLSASVLLGVLMALFGQVYQTGADPWQLFFNWALLITPWVIVARLPALWLLWIALINVSAVLYYSTFFSLFGGLLVGEGSERWFMFVFNGLALALWEWLARRRERPEWALRIVAIAAGFAMTSLALEWVLSPARTSALVLLAYAGALAATYWVYRYWRFDLMLLAGGCMSVIMVLQCLLFKAIADTGEAAGMLLLAMSLLGMGTGAALWLKQVSAKEQARHE